MLGFVPQPSLRALFWHECRLALDIEELVGHQVFAVGWVNIFIVYPAIVDAGFRSSTQPTGWHECRFALDIEELVGHQAFAVGWVNVFIVYPAIVEAGFRSSTQPTGWRRVSSTSRWKQAFQLHSIAP